MLLKKKDDGPFLNWNPPAPIIAEQNEDPLVTVFKGPPIDYTYIVDENSFAAGDTVVKQGNHGNWLWVILDGTVDIYKEADQGNVPILRAARGTFLGTILALTQRLSRQTTIVAHTDLQLGVLDPQLLLREFSGLSFKFKSLVSSLDKRLNQTILNAASCFFKYHDASEIIESANPITARDMDGNETFIVDHGRAYVVRTTDENNDVLIAALSGGDLFGRIPFLNFDHEPETASIYGTLDIQMHAIDVNELQNEYNLLSNTFKNMLVNCASMISGITTTACKYAKKRPQNAETNNRKNSRFNSSHLISYSCHDNDGKMVQQGMGRTLNVCQGGILLETHKFLDPIHTLILKVGIRDEIFDIKGNIIHFRDSRDKKFKTGVKFLEIQPFPYRKKPDPSGHQLELDPEVTLVRSNLPNRLRPPLVYYRSERKTDAGNSYRSSSIKQTAAKQPHIPSDTLEEQNFFSDIASIFEDFIDTAQSCRNQIIT